MTCWTPTCEGTVRAVAWDLTDPEVKLAVCMNCAYNAVAYGGDGVRTRELGHGR